MEAVNTDTFVQAFDKVRQGTVGKTNLAMSRLKLFQQMGKDMQQFAPWSKEVYKQAKRCNWSSYSAEEAAREAILYQTSDQKLRIIILAQDMSLPWDSHTRSQTRRHSWSLRPPTRKIRSGS